MVRVDTVVTGTERYWTVQYGHRLALLVPNARGAVDFDGCDVGVDSPAGRDDVAAALDHDVGDGRDDLGRSAGGPRPLSGG